MNPIPITQELASARPWMVRLVIAGPNGDLTNDGSSPSEAMAIEALFGLEDGWPVFVERWKPEDWEYALLADEGEVELRLYVPQLVVHSMGVVQAQSRAAR